MTELWQLDAREVADRVRSGDLRATDVLDACLARIDAGNGALNAMVFLDPDFARRTAERVDADVAAGRDPGLLAGVPLAVKELESFAGWPETRASTALKDRIATKTTTMTTRLMAAGAVPVGLSASPEFGLLFFTNSVLHGPTRNPWDLSRTPGGSSGGSGAALAAGFVPLATGSDQGGSIRIPASYCGVVGVKGTAGLVSRAPRFGGSGSTVHYGPMARSVGDVARYLDAVVGVDQGDPLSVPAPSVRFESAIDSTDLRGVRLAFLEDLGRIAPEAGVLEVSRAAAADLIAAAGLTSVPGQSLPFPDLVPVAAGMLLLDANPADAPIMAEVIGNLSRTEGAEVLVSGVFGGTPPGAETLAQLNVVRNQINGDLADLFTRADLLVLPTAPTPAFGAAGPMPTTIAGRDVGFAASVGYTSPFNLSGHPVVAVPAGMVDGLPVGIQIVARRHEDALALAAAAALERARPWPKVTSSFSRGPTSGR